MHLEHLASSSTCGIFLGAGGGDCERDDTGDGVGESSRSFRSRTGALVAALAAAALLL